MKNICLISDTHGKIESWVFKHFEDSDEIWHCGDLGSINIIDSINKSFKFRAVYGNIDNARNNAIIDKGIHDSNDKHDKNENNNNDDDNTNY